MKYFAFYWLVGCLLAGGGAGFHKKMCPNDGDIQPMDFIVGIATWPAVFTYIMEAPKVEIRCVRNAQ